MEIGKQTTPLAFVEKIEVSSPLNTQILLWMILAKRKFYYEWQINYNLELIRKRKKDVW